MKTDFSQRFDRLNTIAYLIIEVGASSQFVLLASHADAEEYGEVDAVRTLDLELEGKDTVTMQVARYLASEGFMLNNLRQLVCETRVEFSFIDDRPGSERDVVALHVRVDITERTPFEKGEARLVSLEEYADYLGGLLFSTRVLGVGIARLVSERNIVEGE